ncbi:porin family protein [Gammaproteobacteria bacterium]|nr:porin family protein [Gammaproteobacteria bacterium]
MLNQSTLKVSTITLAIAGTLSLGVALPVYASDYEGNIRGMIGQKSLESDDWGSMDQQDTFGILFDIKKKAWPVSISIDLFGSGTDSNNDDLIRDQGYTVEQHFGVRKTWSFDNSNFHPYAGGGLAIINAGFEQRDSVGGAKDDDTGTGPWIGGGAYWNVTSNINLGVDVRYSKADVTVFDQEINAGGLLAGLTVGYNW